MRLSSLSTAAFLITAVPFQTARLSPAAQRSFDDYVATLETRLAQHHATSQPQPGVLRIEPVNGGTWPVSGGLLHHWRGALFVPGANANDMLALLRDYDGLPKYYAPEVQSSRVLADRGNAATIAIRLKKHKLVTVVLDAEYDVHSEITGDGGGYAFSRSAHIWEVEDPGTAHEHRRPEGDDDGFLWRLNSYWRFREVPHGLVIECEAVSLTRDIPTGLGWLITPIIEQLPRESLEFTLQATQKALAVYQERNTR